MWMEVWWLAKSILRLALAGMIEVRSNGSGRQPKIEADTVLSVGKSIGKNFAQMTVIVVRINSSAMIGVVIIVAIKFVWRERGF